MFKLVKILGKDGKFLMLNLNLLIVLELECLEVMEYLVKVLLFKRNSLD